ncbi:peptide ABC transporter substrate-binding protein [Chlamydiota bacterium]
MRQHISILMIVLAISLAGCQQTKQPTQRKTITLNLQEGDPPTLHPYMGVDLRSRCLFLTLFEPLMRNDAQGELKPAAAQSVEIDSSQTVYTFHIRPHKWSDGTPVTSFHFEKGWKYALTPGTPCFRTDLFYPIKNAEKVKKGELPLEALGIHAPNPETLVVTLEHPTPYFLDLTATSFFAPLYEAAEAEPKHFNGPYIVKQWTHDQALVLEANPNYWDTDSLHVQEICFTMVRDPSTAFALFEKGDLDLVGDPFSPLPFDMIPSLEKTGDLQKKTISRIFYLLLNTDTPPLNVKSFRRALSLCIDRELLTQHLFFGEVPTVTSLPRTLSGLNEKEIGLYTQDPKKLFEQALKELGTDREHFPTIVLSYAELSGQKKLAEFIQEQWKEKLGIKVDLMCNEWNVHSANLRKGNYQIGTLHLTTLYQDPMFYFDLFRDKKSLCNYCKWENPQFKALLEASEQTCDSVERRRYMQEAERQLLEEMPVIALFTQNLQYLMQDRINLEISNLGIYDFKNSTAR